MYSFRFWIPTTSLITCHLPFNENIWSNMVILNTIALYVSNRLNNIAYTNFPQWKRLKKHHHFSAIIIIIIDFRAFEMKLCTLVSFNYDVHTFIRLILSARWHCILKRTESRQTYSKQCLHSSFSCINNCCSTASHHRTKVHSSHRLSRDIRCPSSRKTIVHV